MNQIGVIFDKDGVIVNNNEFHKKAWKVYFEKYNIYLDDEQFKQKVYGRTNENILKDLYNNRLSNEELVAHSEEKEAIFRELFKPYFSLTTGLADFMTALRNENFPVALATNAPQSNIDYTIEMGGLQGFFKSIVNPGKNINPKPEPDIYLKSAENLGIDPHNCVVFEDSLTGIEAAKNAGTKVVAVTSTFSADEITNADKIINNFTEITVEKIKELFIN